MTTVLPALLAGLAIAVMLPRPRAATRLRELTPRAAAQPREGMSPALTRGVPVLAGTLLALLLGGVPGVAVGAVVALAGPHLLARLDRPEDDSAALAAQLPLALDLLGSCLVGGATLDDAVAAVAQAVPGPVGHRLRAVHAALVVGSSPADAFGRLGSDRGPAGTVARALSRSAEGGAPVALAVTRVASDARRAAAAEATSRARKSGVTAAAPLGACFLPAFLLIGVVPTVVGLAGPMIQGVT